MSSHFPSAEIIQSLGSCTLTIFVDVNTLIFFMTR